MSEQPKTEEPPLHSTDDIYLAAFLRYNGHEVRDARADNGNSGFVVFGFNRTDELLLQCNEYAGRSGEVEPRQYIREVTNIRSLIDQARREKGARTR